MKLTKKEIAQGKLHDVKTGTKNAVKRADENKKHSQKKAEHVSSDIKKGFHEVAKDIDKMAAKFSHTANRDRY